MVFDATSGYEGDEELVTALPTECHGGPDCRISQVVDGTLVKVMSWYDNEWGSTCQMIREAFAALALLAPDLSQAGP